MSDHSWKVVDATCATYDANASYYGEISEDYSRFPGLRSEVVEFARDALRGMPVLDLGCGGGRDSRLLASLGRDVIAGDYSSQMLEWARDQSVKNNCAASFVRLNALTLPFQDCSIGGVWASGSLLHIPSACLNRSLMEVYRVLAPGGIAKISMRCGADEGWRFGGSLNGQRWFTLTEPDSFEKHLNAAGFTSPQIRFSGRPGWFVAVVAK